MQLFDQEAKKELTRSTPLADRMRPKTLFHFFGQEHVVGEGKIIRSAIETDELVSMIFWGPPVAGKTTLAQIIAAGETKSHFFSLNAEITGIADLRKVIVR